MKRKLALLLMMSMALVSLSACGKKEEPKESIQRIEASDAAESKEASERQYEDTNKEPVVAPDRNGSNNQSEEQEEETDTSGVDTSIYGRWYDDEGSAFSIYEEDGEVKFSGYDAETDRGLFGKVQTDESTYIEFTQKKDIPEEEFIEEEEEEETIPEGIDLENLEDGWSYDPEKGLSHEVNVIEQYGSEEEFNKAMEEEAKRIEAGTLDEDLYETIRYNIDGIEVRADEHIVVMTISNESKTYVLKKNI